jgi:hydroxyacylglutathione hydrolase
MFFKRIYTPQLAINTYLLGDEKAKQCVVVDPTRHIVPYIVEAQNAGLEITSIVETHVHADFVSGAKELKHQLNGKPRIYASGLGGPHWIPAYTDEVVQEGTQLRIGCLRLDALHTPGHTPEHISWLCYDEVRSVETPWFAFTGDCLFVGSVGRPDLLDEQETPGLVKQLYYTLFEKLAALPSFVEILPSHGAGSLCGKAINGRQTSTLGYEYLFNPYLKQEAKELWMKKCQQDLPPAPPYFRRLKRVNLEGPALLSTLKTETWDAHQATKQLDELFLLDIRPPEAFAASHLKRSLNIPLSPSFCHWAGWMVPPKTAIGLVTENGHIISEAIDQLRLMGFDQEIWVIRLDQIDAQADPHLFSSFPLLEVEEVVKRQDLLIVDVRTPSEWQAGHIAGAQHIELNELEKSLQQLSKQQTLAFVCRSGIRASLAASLLEKHGYPSVLNVRGGMQAWQQAGLPLAK